MHQRGTSKQKAGQLIWMSNLIYFIYLGTMRQLETSNSLFGTFSESYFGNANMEDRDVPTDLPRFKSALIHSIIFICTFCWNFSYSFNYFHKLG